MAERAVQIRIVLENVVGFYLNAYVSQSGRRSVSDPVIANCRVD